MSYLNDRLEANQEAVARQRAESRPLRASRFRFEPDTVMERLRSRIVGQDEVLAAMEGMLTRVKADIGEDHRPLAVHLFLGPTGVGKTETARLIAEAIHGDRDSLCRIDMNTLAQEHYAAALTGAPPGYVGSKEGHSLFNADKVQGSFSKPGVVLFDEIEKASPEVIRTLLNVLDTGRLVFPAGNREIDFRNALIFLTSNAGATEAADYRQLFDRGWRCWLGLKPGPEDRFREAALRRHFDPEFLNRIDGIHSFDSLAKDWLDDLLGIELAALEHRLRRKQVTLTVTEEVKRLLRADFDNRYGARSLRRSVRSRLEPALASAILAHPETAVFRAVVTAGQVQVAPAE